MKQIGKMALVSAVALALAGAPLLAQDHPDNQPNRDTHADQHYVRHNDWRKGGRISHDDWQRGRSVDWKAHHLRQPPRGYEWREVDGNYVLAAVATGLIASVIVASSQPH